MSLILAPYWWATVTFISAYIPFYGVTCDRWMTMYRHSFSCNRESVRVIHLTFPVAGERISPSLFTFFGSKFFLPKNSFSFFDCNFHPEYIIIFCYALCHPKLQDKPRYVLSIQTSFVVLELVILSHDNKTQIPFSGHAIICSNFIVCYF